MKENSKFDRMKNEFKKKFLLKTIRSNKGDVVLVSKKLGIDRVTIYQLIGFFKIRKEADKARNGRKFMNNPSIKKSEINKYSKAVHDFEMDLLIETLISNGGFISNASRVLEIHRNSIHNKVLEHGLLKYVNKIRKDRRNRKEN